MSNNKQSSVEFLIKSFQGAYGDKVTNIVSDLIEQAKAMHKDEIKSAFNVGCDVYYNLNVPSNSEQYYKETFEDENL